MRIRPELERILDKAQVLEPLTRQEAAWLIREVDPPSFEYYSLIGVANRLTRASSGNRAEIHAQIGVNVAPCPFRCGFCSFSAQADVFQEPVELSSEEVAGRAVQLATDGANVLYLMTTGNYDFDRFLRVAATVRSELPAEIPLVANTGDLSPHQAQELAAAGFVGAYHTVRMGEGRDTAIQPKRRMATMEAIVQAGLRLAYCVEPIGPEHTVEEIVEKMFIGKEFGVWFSGAMRRISVPGTALAGHGMLSEIELAKIVAIVRLVMGNSVLANCTHEPNVPSLLAGANLIWAESGSNPRDTRKETTEYGAGRGLTVADCARLLREAGYEVRGGPPASLAGLQRTSPLLLADRSLQGERLSLGES
jgi:biotin synthase